MKTTIHRADSRGHANHGWLDTYHTFSFANYYDPERIHFGALRVLNDDWVEGGQGFGKHPHDNMEIVTIMLEGELRHSDSMGHSQTLVPNEVQAMSAGTGIFHSEFNNLDDKPLRLLQIWVFPEQKNLKPRYEQKMFDSEQRVDNWQLLAGPNQPNALDIKQDAYFSRATLSEGNNLNYELHNDKNGVYLFLIDGQLSVNGGLQLNKRDGVGISEAHQIPLQAQKKSDVLAIEVPMF